MRPEGETRMRDQKWRPEGETRRGDQKGRQEGETRKRTPEGRATWGRPKGEDHNWESTPRRYKGKTRRGDHTEEI